MSVCIKDSRGHELVQFLLPDPAVQVSQLNWLHLLHSDFVLGHAARHGIRLAIIPEIMPATRDPGMIHRKVQIQELEKGDADRHRRAA